MPLWLWIVLLAGLIKLPIAALLLWIPFRYDESMNAPETSGGSEDDGGSHALPAGPTEPHPREPRPRKPRRGPHGSPSPAPPRRSRTPLPVKRPSRVGG